DRAPRLPLLPIAGVSIVLLDVAAIDVFAAGRPELLATTLPALGHVLLTIAPIAGYVTAAAGLLAAPWGPACAPAPAPAALAAVSRWGSRRAFMPAATAIVLATAAYTLHASAARDQAELTRRLAVAIASRDRGDLEPARQELTAVTQEFRGSHVPLVVLGE